MACDATQHLLPFPTLVDECERSEADRAAPVRGVRWVLCWAMALAVLGWTAAILLAFAYQLSAEQALFRAAAAGLREATCERATSHTVEQTIRRRLVDRRWHQDTSVALQRNGLPVSGVIRPVAGDRLSMSLTVPVDAALPAWLQMVLPVQLDRPITVWVQHQMTGP